MLPLSNTTISSSSSIAFASSSTLSSQITLNQLEFIQKELNLRKTIPQKLKIYQSNESVRILDRSVFSMILIFEN